MFTTAALIPEPVAAAVKSITNCAGVFPVNANVKICAAPLPVSFTVNVSPGSKGVGVEAYDFVLVTDGQLAFQSALPTTTQVPAVFLYHKVGTVVTATNA